MARVPSIAATSRVLSVVLAGSLAIGAPSLAFTAGSDAASASGACDESCLLRLADSVVEALAAKDFRRLPWADPVRYTENNVSLMIGDAGWGSAGATVGPKAFAFADVQAGNVVWFGTIWDHDAPAFGAIRLGVKGGKIAELELIAARKPWPIPFGDPQKFTVSPSMTTPVAQAARRSRERLVDLADSYLATKQRNNGALLATFAPRCAMIENGVQIDSVETEVAAKADAQTDAQADAAKADASKAEAKKADSPKATAPKAGDCASAFRAGSFAPVERIRDRRFPVVDPERGLVLAISVQDLPARTKTFTSTRGKTITVKRDYPMSRLVAELVRIEGDTVVRSEAVVTSLPYYMPTPWSAP